MNDNDIERELESLPGSAPTLRRQHAATNNRDARLQFFDIKTQEVIWGIPDPRHLSNKNLIKLHLWQSGRCKPNLFFTPPTDEYGDDAGMTAIVSCSVS